MTIPKSCNNTMSKRIAIVGIYHESNTFVDSPTTMIDFEKGYLLRGEAIRAEYAAAHHEVGGMIEVIDQAGMEAIPVFFASATPGGTIEADTFNALLDELLERLDAVLPIDGCLVSPHGAGVTEEHRDMDGYWLQKVREKLGPAIPIVSSLDLHANVSPAMIEATNAMVSYKKNPHVDMRETGKAAAQMLVDTLLGNIIPTQVLVQTPVSISIEQQFTSQEPCLSLYAFANKLAQQEGVVSLSILLGFPYADVEEMGTSIIVVTNNDPALALSVGKSLEQYIIEHREQYVGEKFTVKQAIQQALPLEKPVLFLDMGDNIGGGSPGNNTCILEGLLEEPSLKYFVCIYDPQAVQQAKQLAIGETGLITFTGTSYRGVKQLQLSLTLESSSDGHFQEQSPRHGGQLNYYMGDTVVMRTDNGSTIMFISLRVPPFSLQQLYANGVAPEEYDILTAKGVIAPLAAYAPVSKSSIQVNTPGTTQADATQFTYAYRRKPLFPFESIN